MPTRKELIASGAEITPLTREEILMQGGELTPLNVKEKVLKGIVGGDAPTGKITITENGTDIDVAQYATADVNVPSAPNYNSLTIKNSTTGTIYAPKIEFTNGAYKGRADTPVIISKNTEKSIILPIPDGGGVFWEFVLKAAASSSDWSTLKATATSGTVRVLGVFRPTDDPADDNYRAVLSYDTMDSTLGKITITL